MFELSQDWIDYLITQHESGMGYQLVDVTFMDGTVVERAIVLNCQFLMADGVEGKSIKDIKVRPQKNRISRMFGG